MAKPDCFRPAPEWMFEPARGQEIASCLCELFGGSRYVKPSHDGRSWKFDLPGKWTAFFLPDLLVAEIPELLGRGHRIVVYIKKDGVIPERYQKHVVSIDELVYTGSKGQPKLAEDVVAGLGLGAVVKTGASRSVPPCTRRHEMWMPVIGVLVEEQRMLAEKGVPLKMPSCADVARVARKLFKDRALDRRTYERDLKAYSDPMPGSLTAWSDMVYLYNRLGDRMFLLQEKDGHLMTLAELVDTATSHAHGRP